MKQYGYIALDRQGVEQQGQIEAYSEREARAQLRAQGVRVVRLADGPLARDGLLARLQQVWMRVRPGRWLPPRAGDFGLMFRQLALMLRAGHTVLQALETAGQLTGKIRLARVLQRLAAAIRSGSSLSAALADEKALFPPLTVRLIASGEASGELDAILERLADNAERSQDLRRQLLASLLYPGIVVLAAVGVIGFLVTSVVPRFATFLESRGKQVPAAAQFLMDSTHFLTNQAGLISGVVLGLAAATVLAYATPAGRRVLDRSLLFLPVVGGSVTAANMAQAAWTFGMLVKSGLTVLDSLKVTANVATNTVFQRAFQRASDEVLAGKSLSVALQTPVMPTLFRHMTAIGEQSGELEVVMESLGLYYRKELDSRIKLMSAMIEPLLILVVGGVVGFVYYAFFQAVMAVSTGG